MSSNTLNDMMSTKIYKKIDFYKTLERIRTISNLSKDKDIAELLGISAQNFGNLKKLKSEKLALHFLNWGLNNGINLNWLFLGDGFPYLEQELDLNEPFIEIVNQILTRDDVEIDLKINRRKHK